MTAPQNPRVTQADIRAAAIYWVGSKNRETFQSDIDYFEANWRSLPGMEACVFTFARHREAAEAASKARTLSDHGRMLWRDDVEGHCPSPELCFEYGPTVRCSPCAIKQADAAGVVILHPDRTYSPQECRLKRELAASKAREAALVEALEAIRKTMDGYRSQMKFCDVEALSYFREFDRRIEASGFRAALTSKEPDA